MAEQLNGNCYLCGASLGKTAMRTHLFKLHAEDKGGQECSLLKIENAFDKKYWLYVDIPKNDALEELDYFLRQIWLECCGHMSAFMYPKYNEIDMNRKIRSFDKGDKFLHHYDFGSTTETVITVMGNTMRKKQKESVRLMARNAPFVFKCSDCGKEADYIYMEAGDDWEMPFYCEECSEKYEDYMLNPICNSPRMGTCGYAGETDTFTFDPEAFAQKLPNSQYAPSAGKNRTA